MRSKYESPVHPVRWGKRAIIMSGPFWGSSRARTPPTQRHSYGPRCRDAVPQAKMLALARPAKALHGSAATKRPPETVNTARPRVFLSQLRCHLHAAGERLHRVCSQVVGHREAHLSSVSIAACSPPWMKHHFCAVDANRCGPHQTTSHLQSNTWLGTLAGSWLSASDIVPALQPQPCAKLFC